MDFSHSPESAQHASLAINPDENPQYTPGSCQSSLPEFSFDWSPTSGASEADCSSLSSEPFSPDRSCGLGLGLPSFEIQDSHYHQQPWHLQQQGFYYACQSTPTTSMLPVVEPNYLVENPLHEKYDLGSTSLPIISWDVLHTMSPGESQAVSPSCSSYSMLPHTSPMTSPFAYSKVDFSSVGSPFVKVEFQQQSQLLQHTQDSGIRSPLNSPWKVETENLDSAEERGDMSMILSESPDGTYTKPSITPVTQSRPLSSNYEKPRTVSDRKKKKQTTPQNARHSCQVCGMLFQRRNNHKQHMVTHQPNRVQPFKCDFEGCNESSARQADLNRHIKSVHLKIRDHECLKCNKAFSRKDTLTRHELDGCRRRFKLKTRVEKPRNRFSDWDIRPRL